MNMSDKLVNYIVKEFIPKFIESDVDNFFSPINDFIDFLKGLTEKELKYYFITEKPVEVPSIHVGTEARSYIEIEKISHKMYNLFLLVKDLEEDERKEKLLSYFTKEKFISFCFKLIDGFNILFDAPIDFPEAENA